MTESEKPIMVPADDADAVKKLFGLSPRRAAKYLPSRMMRQGAYTKRFYVVREVEEYLTQLPQDNPLYRNTA